MRTQSKESAKVQKARKKLERRLANEAQLINAKALDKMREIIHLRLEKQKKELLILKNKEISSLKGKSSAKIQESLDRRLLPKISQPSEDFSQQTSSSLEGRLRLH